MNSSELDIGKFLEEKTLIVKEHIPSIVQALEICITVMEDHVSKQNFNELYDFIAILEKLISFLCELSGFQVEEQLLFRIVTVY